jgi:uncharacterized protein (TIGR03032 family)
MNREIRYAHSPAFASLLERLRISLLVSTYQASKLVVIGTYQGALALSFHNFDQPMGVAIGEKMVAVGTRTQIWILRSAPQIAPKVDLAGKYDSCFLTRASHVTGEIRIHEMAWSGSELWIVNTLFSCLCTVDERYSFVPRWQPPFVSALASEDRCHLNGLAVVDGKAKFVTALGQTDTAQGWRTDKASGGCLIDVESGRTLVQELAMPHSPRVYGNRLWLLDSGRGQVVTVDATTGKTQKVAELPGYTRGLAFYESFAFVGLSKIRETSVFGGIPIADHRDQLKCAIAIIQLTTGKCIAYLEFKSGVDEIFDVQLLPNTRLPVISGPFVEADGSDPIWLVPDAN